MQELDAILTDATAAVGEHYFRLPIEAGEATLFERNYCYELYHQMRLRWPLGSRYSLNGEVDKRWHPVIRNLGEAQVIPDLLVHTPGSMEGNHAIIEVKRANTDPAGIRKDLTTLTRFMRDDIHYERGIYLIFGGIDPERVARAARGGAFDRRIELWLHDRVGGPAVRVLTLADLEQERPADSGPSLSGL
jgi:hypothetical protein